MSARARHRPGASVIMSALVAVVVFAAAATPATAQDIEAVARQQGIPVPAGYYARIAADSTAFTLPNGLFRTEPTGARIVSAITGTRRIAVIPALFSDSPEPHISRETIQQVIFDGPAERGTLTEAYREMSRGAFTVTGEVAPWVRTSLIREEVVGASSGLGEDAKVGAFLIDALTRIDPSYDFSLYDNNGPDGVPNSSDDDGFVDAIAFEFIEVAGSCGGPGIWPHLWGIAPQNDGEPFVTDDVRPDGSFVMVNAYIIQSAVDCDGETPQDASTIAHEFGHVLGLPDYYHPTDAEAGSFGRRWVLGCWELMAAGAWGCGQHGENRAPFGPTHLSARSKNLLDWVQYVSVDRDARDEEFVLDPVQTAGQALRIPLDATGREWLLMEYRTQAGFDAEIPAEGVLVYHQDFEGKFRPTEEEFYFLRLAEQDDNAGLLRNTLEGGNRGEAGDAWGVGGVDQKFHGLSTPALRRNSGGPVTTTLHSIRIEDGKARVRVSTAATPEVVAPDSPLEFEQVAPFERRLRIGGGVMPYALESEVPDGMTAEVEDDEVVLAGSLAEEGPFEVALRVMDAGQAASPWLRLPASAGAWMPSTERLVQSFLGSAAEPLAQPELNYLDLLGNRNGRYDVGDLRAWLRSTAGG